MLIVGRINFKALFIIFGLLFVPLFSRAQVVINEVMYDLSGTDTGREWIEIYNGSSAAIDISNWKLFEANTNHGLTNIQGGTSLASGGYAIIADDPTKFLADWSGFSGILFGSAFSLSNSGETLGLKENSTTTSFVDQITYDPTTGAGGDGNSLQKSESSWLSATPTPGVVNALSTNTTSTTTDSTATTTTTQTTSTNTTNTNTTLSAHYGSAGLSIVEPISKFEIGAGRARLGMVDTPMQFKPEMKYSYSGNMTFKWSFGDGAIGYGQVLSHSYAYPGEYVVILNVSSAGGQAVSRVNVKIVPADISISLASSERVEVSNNSKTEINLFGRALSSQGKLFVFPEDTIIKAGQKISFASSITGLQPFNENNVSMIVVGDSLNKAFIPVVQIAENKPDDKKLQIEVLYSKAQEIQKQLATLPKESNFAVSPRNDQNTAAAFVALNLISSSSTTTKQISRRGWFQTVKEFFLGRKQ